MIEGIRIEVPAADLRRFLVTAAERVDATVARAREILKEHEAGHADTMPATVGMFSLADAERKFPGLRSLANTELITKQIELYEARARMWRYAAEHLSDQTARLTIAELDMLMVGA